MENDEARELRERARGRATQTGFFDDADDLAQEVMLSYLSGNGAHQKVGHAVIDATRKLKGDPRTEVFAVRSAFESMGEGIENESEGIEDFSEILDRKQKLNALLDALQGADRVLVCLLIIYGMDHREISYCFGVTESRISQRLGGLSTRIYAAMVEAEQRESQRLRHTPEGILESVAHQEQRASEAIPGEVRGEESGTLQDLEEGIPSAEVGRELGVVSGRGERVAETEPRESKSDLETSFNEWLT